mmetsp:Transcript_10319/g.26276  ORF Transcript_10319/g.26276 Transcript_10319/m.26276 type:complete len:254 (+) Transcript_10319:58-819(+)
MALSTRHSAVVLAALLVAAYCASSTAAAKSTATVDVKLPTDNKDSNTDQAAADPPAEADPGAPQDLQTADDSTKPCGCSACQNKRQPGAGIGSRVQWPRSSLFSDLDALLFDRPFLASAWSDVPRKLGLDSFFREDSGGSLTNVGIRTLASDEEKTVLGVRLPGVPRENLQVSVDAEGLLTVEGGYTEAEAEATKPAEGKAEDDVRHQFQFFAQRQLPFGVDASRVSAEYKDGLLRVTVPNSSKHDVTRVSIA